MCCFDNFVILSTKSENSSWRLRPCRLTGEGMTDGASIGDKTNTGICIDNKNEDLCYQIMNEH